VLLVSLGLLFGYPLSAGPAVLLYFLAGEPPILEALLETVYRPLEALPEPIEGLLSWWVDLWVELGS
jgi:hypothetical protein